MTPWVQRLIIANVLMFFVEMTAPGIINALALQPRFVVTEPWTLVTYMFLHDPRGITHILFNMFALYMFGSRVEERMGGSRFLTLYFISGLAGALLSIILAPRSAVIGASGAIFGIMLAFARFFPVMQPPPTPKGYPKQPKRARRAQTGCRPCGPTGDGRPGLGRA